MWFLSINFIIHIIENNRQVLQWCDILLLNTICEEKILNLKC